MGSQRTRIGLVVSALALGAGLLLVLDGGHARLGHGPLALPPHAPSAEAAAPGAAAKAGAPSQEERSRLADDLNSPSDDVHSDLRLVNEIFIAYRGATHMENPVGENAEITAVLKGRNRLGYAFIPADNPAINAKGELCDRWGTPFFFHQLSGQRMEIRSAGPDHRLWTVDDQVLTP
jgi:hypothetical protein